MDSDSEVYDTPADGLSNIGAIPTKKTLMLVNNFITNTIDFTNKFAGLCERKLLDISQKTQRLEITLNLLEAKLESVPWLDPESGEAEEMVAPVQRMDDNVSMSQPSPPQQQQEQPTPNAAAVNVIVEVPAAPSNFTKLKDDERYGPYFKMLRLGIPKPSVEQKMMRDTGGELDPSYLDRDPDSPAPDYTNALILSK